MLPEIQVSLYTALLNIVAPICLHNIYSCFWAITAELGGDRNCIAPKAWNIYYLIFYEKFCQLLCYINQIRTQLKMADCLSIQARGIPTDLDSIHNSSIYLTVKLSK